MSFHREHGFLMDPNWAALSPEDQEEIGEAALLELEARGSLEAKNANKQSPFLAKLPLECRHIIYDYVLVQDEPLNPTGYKRGLYRAHTDNCPVYEHELIDDEDEEPRLCTFCPGHGRTAFAKTKHLKCTSQFTQESRIIKLRPSPLSLLLTCQQVNEEATPRFYGSNTFAFMQDHVMEYHLEKFGSSVSHIRSIQMNHFVDPEEIDDEEPDLLPSFESILKCINLRKVHLDLRVFGGARRINRSAVTQDKELVSVLKSICKLPDMEEFVLKGVDHIWDKDTKTWACLSHDSPKGIGNLLKQTLELTKSKTEEERRTIRARASLRALSF